MTRLFNRSGEPSMKATIALCALLVSFGTGSVFAADEAKKEASPAQKAQQEKMKACNADAGKQELKGDARKKFMSECLGGKSATGDSACAASAAEKKLAGAAKNSFIKKCEADAKAPAVPAPAAAAPAAAAKPTK